MVKTLAQNWSNRESFDLICKAWNSVSIPVLVTPSLSSQNLSTMNYKFLTSLGSFFLSSILVAKNISIYIHFTYFYSVVFPCNSDDLLDSTLVATCSLRAHICGSFFPTFAISHTVKTHIKPCTMTTWWEEICGGFSLILD